MGQWIMYPCPICGADVPEAQFPHHIGAHRGQGWDSAVCNRCGVYSYGRYLANRFLCLRHLPQGLVPEGASVR